MSTVVREEDVVSIEPERPRIFALAAVSVAVLAGWWVVDAKGPGLFITILAMIAGAAVYSAGSFPTDRNGIVLAALAALAAVAPTLRAADWILPLDLIGGAGLAAVAIGGSSTWKQAFKSIFAPPLRLLLVPRVLIRNFMGASSGDKMIPALRGILIGAIIVSVFGALFAGADQLFSRYVSELFDWDLGLIPARLIVGAFTLAIVSAFSVSGKRFDPMKPRLWAPWLTEDSRRQPRRILSPGEWTGILAALDVLFFLFVVLQLTVLFAGKDHVLRTAGLTYAEYARQGFGQLIAAATLTLGVVAASIRWGDINREKDGAVRRTLLGILCVLTGVIIASAIRRLGLYEDAFGFTRARLFGHGFALWLGFIFVLLLVAGAAKRKNWLPFAVIASTGLALFVFNLINPDRFIADHNVTRFASTGKIDLLYLSRLSADAIPELTRLPEPTRSCALREIRDGIKDEPWWSFNLARHRGREVSEASEPVNIACPEVSYFPD